MRIDFEVWNQTVIPDFRGGESQISAKMFAGSHNRVCAVTVQRVMRTA